MKELTIEEKAKAYDEAIDKVAHFIKKHIGFGCMIHPNSSEAKELFNIFPELQKSDDDSIRKEIISALKYANHKGVYDKHLAWLEKQAEQKPTDKVEPKFKVGDWILYSGDHYEGVRHITKIDENGYYIERNGLPHGIIPFNHEICMRLWTIQDVKDGDVLAYKDEISIYKHDIKNCTKEGTNFGGFVYHCCYDGKRFITDSLYSLTEKDKKDIYPATKEQHDILIKAMADAGYEWDVEKKELKKQEIAEIPFGAKDSELQEATYYIPKGFYSVLDGNKVIIKRFKNPRPQNN